MRNDFALANILWKSLRSSVCLTHSLQCLYVSTININISKSICECALISISTQNRYVLWKFGIIHTLFFVAQAHRAMYSLDWKIESGEGGCEMRQVNNGDLNLNGRETGREGWRKKKQHDCRMNSLNGKKSNRKRTIAWKVMLRIKCLLYFFLMVVKSVTSTHTPNERTFRKGSPRN